MEISPTKPVFFLYVPNEGWTYGHSSPHVMSFVTDHDLKKKNPPVLEDPLNLAEIHQMQLQVQEAPVIQVQPAPVVLANNYTAEMNFISSLFVASLKYARTLLLQDGKILHHTATVQLTWPKRK